MSHIERVKQALMRTILTPTEADHLHAIIRARTITDEPDPTRPTVREALDAVNAAAYQVHDPGAPDHGTRIVHTIDSQGHGQDWQLADIQRVILTAGQSRLGWNARTDRHRLTIDRGSLGALHVDTTNTGALTR